MPRVFCKGEDEIEHLLLVDISSCDKTSGDKISMNAFHSRNMNKKLFDLLMLLLFWNAFTELII